MRTAFLTLAVAFLIAGCGYKGPLYLPQPKPVAQKPPAPAASTPSATPTPAPPAEPAQREPEDAVKQ